MVVAPTRESGIYWRGGLGNSDDQSNTCGECKMGVRLESITVRGFKTIRNLDGFEPGPMNVLIGPNGVGKSNFISFFRLLSWMLTPPGNLQEHVATLGGANALLHKGAQVTRDIRTELVFHTDVGENEYQFWLSHAAGDTFIFTNSKSRSRR
jgi:predicted ATPase